MYQMGSNNILKNNKFVNAKGSYVVSVGSTHNWLFKVKHLFLPEITINYLTNRFPFIVNYLIVKSNFKSIQHYAKYIESHACVEGDDPLHGKHGSGRHDRDGRGASSGHPYGGKLFLSLSSTDNTTANVATNTIRHFRDDPHEQHSHTLNSVQSMNSRLNITRVKEGKSRVTTPHAHKSRRSGKKSEGGLTQNGFSEFDAYRAGSACGVRTPCDDRRVHGDDYTRRTGGPNALPSKDAKKIFYANSESIFEDNNGDKFSKDKSDHLQNKQPHTSRPEWKEKTQRYYKIKATNNLFRDELVDDTEKVDCIERNFLNKVGGAGDYSPRYDCFVDMDHSGKAKACVQRECPNSAVSLTNATCAATSRKAANSIKTMSSMNTLNTLNTINSMNSGNSEKKLHTKSSVNSMKSVTPKRLDYYANSNFESQSTTINTSFSTEQYKDSFSKLRTGERLEQAPRNDPSDDPTLRSDANPVRQKLSSPTPDVTDTAEDGAPTEEKNPSFTAPEAESDCTKQTKGNASDRSKRRLNKIKIIGLRFFNKTTSKM
ncbi:hypothetical protein C922_00976 [Plasmodium inui San Antonio 1]|uniref:Uncharacterized protein n=1 Tax=Plasmodium inui San Antonio 1 TaxID=1237626 RepID=W7A620_9APIC|nr:hypothetical protein C922_00976 [Plasmodium inui San Antonio 1]EUD68577.1 hypothetical protein C922_00976 [Plasmodium inui San Antonio 1]